MTTPTASSHHARAYPRVPRSPAALPLPARQLLDLLRRQSLERIDVVVGAGCRLINEGAVKDLDAVDKKTGLGYVIQDGIIVVTKGTVLKPGTVI